MISNAAQIVIVMESRRVGLAYRYILGVALTRRFRPSMFDPIGNGVLPTSLLR